MVITLKTKDACGGGMNKRAKPGASLDDVLEIAENEVTCGYAVWAAVYIDGKLYAEYEDNFCPGYEEDD